MLNELVGVEQEDRQQDLPSLSPEAFPLVFSCSQCFLASSAVMSFFDSCTTWGRSSSLSSKSCGKATLITLTQQIRLLNANTTCKEL